MLIRAAFEAEREYRALRDELSHALGKRSLPFAVTGLCDGASDGLCASLLCDLRTHGASLVLCAEEKECARLAAYLSQAGLRTAVYTGRDLTFHNITASHEYEHERIRVLFGLTRGDFDVVLTTPDAALDRKSTRLNSSHVT